MKTRRLIALIFVILLNGCGDKLNEIPMDKFVGVWELTGRGMFTGIQIKIEKNDTKLNGKIVKLNENKLVKMFAEVGDVWVSDISRSSNFQFRLTEKKIARDLFSMYGLSTSQEFEVEFIDDNTIGLAADGDPQKATVQYKRVE